MLTQFLIQESVHAMRLRPSWTRSWQFETVSVFHEFEIAVQDSVEVTTPVLHFDFALVQYVLVVFDDGEVGVQDEFLEGRIGIGIHVKEFIDFKPLGLIIAGLFWPRGHSAPGILLSQGSAQFDGKSHGGRTFEAASIGQFGPE